MIKAHRFTLLTLVIVALVLSGCRENNTVQRCVVDSQPYSDRSALESAGQPEQLDADEDVFASVYFIESPLGMEYTARWSLDGRVVLTETKAMVTHQRGIMVFSLPAEQAGQGNLKLEIIYGEDVLSVRDVILR